MKKLTKVSMATALVASALTPVAAFAAEGNAPAGFYNVNTGEVVTPDAFPFLSPAKKLEILMNAKNEVYYLDGSGKALAAGVLLTATTNEQVTAAQENETAVEERHDVEFTTGGKVENSVQSKLNVESVAAIDTTTVEVTFAATTEVIEGATVEVKDNNSKVIATNATDIAKGATSAQFDFVTAVDATALTGVWTVNGKEFSFVAQEQLDEIVEEATATALNEVKLLAALNAARINNVDENSLADYANAINIANDANELNSLADVQKVIDEVNELAGEGADEAAIVKAVADATNQVQLLKALQSNFDRVNPDWIVEYAEEDVILADGSNESLLDLDAGNYDNENTNLTVDVNGIQAAIDQANSDSIDAADGLAKNSAEQAKVTTLIEKWVQADNADTPTVTPKTDAIDASKIKGAAFKVAEATTQNSLYSALLAYANTTPDGTLNASELNANLKADYSAALATHTKAQLIQDIKVGPLDIKGKIVQVADASALGKVAKGIVDLTATSTATQVKSALQKYADVTSHLADKFEMTSVNDALLLEYRDVLEAVTLADVDTSAKLTAIIAGVNGAVKVDENVAKVANASSTTLQVRDALTELAAGEDLGVNAIAVAYLNLSSQAKTEVAQFVVDNNENLADPLTAALIVADEGSPTYANAVIKTAIADQEAKVQEFNDIGALATAEIADTKAALDAFDNAAFKALSVAKKFEVAEEINKLTKLVGTTVTPLDFGGADAVTTIAEANAIVETAIAKVK